MITQQALIEFGRIMQESKPHLIAIENEIQKIGHGEITIRIEVRGGNVEKMQFIDAKRNWLKEKATPTIQEKTTVVTSFVQTISNI